MVIDQLIQKLKKLIAHEASARQIGSIAEANAFSEKIASLLFGHKLSMAELEAAEPEEARVDDPIIKDIFDGERHGLKTGTTEKRWLRYLASGVASGTYTRHFYYPGHARQCFVGKRSDVAVAFEIYRLLIQTGLRLEREARKNHRGSLQHFKQEFLQGFAREVNLRFQRQRRQQEVKAHDTGHAQALMVIKSDEALIENFIQTVVQPSKPSVNRTRYLKNAGAYQMGVAAGAKVSLSTSGIGGKEQKQIG